MKVNKSESWILLGIPLLFLVGAMIHFLYGLCGQLIIIGIIAPINESIWEHLKLFFYPLIIWWTIGYAFLKKENPLVKEKWFFSLMISEVTCIISVVAFYYSYTGALGIKSIFLDIFSLALALYLGQNFGIHIYKHCKKSRLRYYVSIMIIIFLVIIFTIFTFNPPKLPLFKDGITGEYGIENRRK